MSQTTDTDLDLDPTLPSDPVVDDPVTDPYADMSAHQRLMMELRKAVDECQQTIEAARKVLESVSDHNADATAHADLRTALNELKQQDTDSVDMRIQQHDESPTAHPILVAKLEAVINDTSNVRTLIDEVVGSHDTSDVSHSDLREALSELKIQLGGMNLSNINESLTRLQTYVQEDLNSAITALQNVDARHDKLIHDNQLATESTNDRISTLTNDIDSLAEVLPTLADIDELKVNNAVNSLSTSLGVKTHDAEGPNLSGLNCTFPAYVKAGQNITFKVSGATPYTSGGNVNFSIEQVGTALTFSPNNNITQNANITCTVGNNVQEGDIVSFKLIAKDSGNSKTTERLIGAMVAKATNVTTLTCDGLPSGVEPGVTYSFEIRNLVDDGTGRLTYGFNSKSSALNFSPSNNVKIGDTVMVSVPASARRNSDLEFAVVIHDKYAADQEKDISVHVNTIAGAEDLVTTVPVTGVPGQSYDIKFSGILSADGTPATYEIANDSDYLSFSKDVGILANENVKMTLTTDAPRGEALRFVVKATDNNQNEISVEQFVTVNLLPSAASVTCALPATTKGGVSLDLKFTGGTDPEAEDAVLTYTIDGAQSGLSFSKLSNIKANEKVVCTVPKVSTDMDKVFFVYAVDSLGEKSAEPHQFTIHVEPIWIANTPYIITPQDGNTVDTNFTMNWSEFTMYTDMSSSVAEQIAKMVNP